MNFSRTTDRRAVTWTLDQGTARTGYPVTALDDLDPSLPHWITGDEIRVVGDLGASLEMQAVFLFAHTFQEGLNVRFQAHATNIFSASPPSPTLDLAIPILAPYRNDFTCHAWLDLVAALPAAVNRTFRYISITNDGDPNDRSVAIGEIWIAGTWREMAPTSIRHDYARPQEQLVSRHASKQGVQTVYDFGSRSRSLTAHVRTDEDGRDQILDWHDDQHGAAHPMVVIVDPTSTNRRNQEPHLCRFNASQITPDSVRHADTYYIDMSFDELGAGAPVDA